MFIIEPEIARGGDSGGPVYIGNPDVEDISLVGVLHGEEDTFLDDVGNEVTPLVPADRGNWLTSFLRGTASVGRDYTGPVDVPPRPEESRARFPRADIVDPDGDGLAGSHDLCPGIFNPLQVDTNADGISDETFTCRRRSTSPPYDVVTLTLTCPVVDSDGDGIVDPCDNCGDPNGDQRDCDFDGIGDACETDSDSDGRPDDCDDCPTVRDLVPENCNEDVEEILGRQGGDQCDPNPCPLTRDETRTDDTEGAPVLTNDGIRGLGMAVNGAIGTLDTGFRFCPCNLTTGDSPDDRRLCLSRGCSIDVRDYEPLGVGPWKPMSLSFVARGAELPARYQEPDEVRIAAGAPARSDFMSATWDFRQDAADFRFPLLPTPAGVTLRGEVWSRGVRYTSASLFGCGSTGTCPTLAGDYNSHYWSGGVWRMLAALGGAGAPPPDAPVMGPAMFPEQPCPMCDAAFPIPYLPRLTCPAESCDDMFVRVLGADLRITDAVGPELLGLLARPLTWIAPTEAPEALPAGAARFAVLDPATGAVQKVVYALGGKLRGFDAGQAPVVPGPDPYPYPYPDPYPPGGSSLVASTPTPIGGDPRAAFTGGDTSGGPAFLLRGETAFLYRVGGIEGTEPALVLRAIDLTGGRLFPVPIVGPRPGRVTAAALHAHAPRAIVLDEDPTGRPWPDRRLLAVDLDTGVSSVVARFPRGRGPYDTYYLAALPDGRFVLAAGLRGAARYTVVTFAADGEHGIHVDGFITGAGEIVGPPHASWQGISLPVRRRAAEGWQPVGHRYSEFRRGAWGQLRDCF